MRVVMDADKVARGLQIRGMGIVDLAQAAGVSISTASSAVRGGQVNMQTALAVARALGARPILEELDSLIPHNL